MRCRRRYVCGCERHAEKDHSTTSARRVRSAWLPRAGGCGRSALLAGTLGPLAPHPALPSDTHECRLTRHPQPALLAKHREPAGTSVRNPSPLPALLAGTHKCRLARRTSDWSFFWGSLSRRLALSLGLIHTIRSQLAPHSPIGRSHCLCPEDMTSTIPEFSPAVSRLAFHNTEASRTQHTHPIKERRERQRGSRNMHLDEAPLQSTRP